MFTKSIFKLEDPFVGQLKITEIENSLIFHYPCTNSENCTNYVGFLSPGTYVLETWGAVGGYNGGKGGYSKGILSLSRKTKSRIFIGAKGAFVEDNPTISPRSFNGGGHAYSAWYDKPESPFSRIGSSGGGASDIRIIGDTKYHRIIVAGGGGGGISLTLEHQDNICGGAGGGESGLSDSQGLSNPGTQKSAGQGTSSSSVECSGSFSGSFGDGGDAPIDCFNTYGGGGGGWYGGASGVLSQSGGAGGSGYVLTSSSEKPNGYFKEYSRFFLSSTIMLNGEEEMPVCSGALNPLNILQTSTTGNNDNGCARITKIGSFYPFSCANKRRFQQILKYCIIFCFSK